MATPKGRSDEAKDVAPDGDAPAAAEPPPAGFLVRRLREGAGLTQDRLAQEIGVDIKTVNSLECGRSALSSHMARRIGATLGQPFITLMKAQLDYENWHAQPKPPRAGPGPRRRSRAEGAEPGRVSKPSQGRPGTATRRLSEGMPPTG